MTVGESLPFIKNYVVTLNEALKESSIDEELTRIQIYWLSFVILGILVTNSVCWARINRSSLGEYSTSAISWMFRKSRIKWDKLLYASTLRIIEEYNIRSGILVVDDTDSERSKQTKKIAKTHKIKDKKRGGYFNGQNLVFLVFVSKQITIPVGFEFYEPNPELKKWKKEDNRLKSLKIAKKDRPKEPKKNPRYPGKKELAIKLLTAFIHSYPFLKIHSVIADSFYGSESFMREARNATKQDQVISQIRKNQLVFANGNYIQIKDYFANKTPVIQTVNLRGNEQTITYCSDKLKVKSHQKKYTIIALKYEDEKEYRYLLISDMTRLAVDVIKTFAIRWLVEVFFQDWKSYEGWDQMAMQPGIDGADRSVTLSLLCDHVLFFHKDQKNLFKNGCSAATVGSLRNKVLMESLSKFIENIVNSDKPKEALEKFNETMVEIFQLQDSAKHMRNIDIDI